MAWTVTVQLDSDKPNVGTATAIWNEGQPDQFSFSHRGESEQIPEFVAAAQEALAQHQSKRQAESDFAATITEQLNGAH